MIPHHIPVHRRPSVRIALLLTLTLTLLILPPAFADPDQINAAISEKGARWTAGETSVSTLSFDEKKRLASAQLSVQSEEVRVGTEAAPTVTAPAQFDMRNIDGRNFITPVRDQGSCGSCWAFAAVGALESRVLQSLDRPGTNLDLAEQVLVSCDSRNQGCNGGELRAASDFLRDNGLPLESCSPYRAASGGCDSACTNWRSSAYRVGFYRPVAVNVQSIKDALVTSGPVPCLMITYDDFFSYKSGVYSHVTGGLVGGHAVLIIGYNEAGQYFTAKNSWGAQWGEAGFFNIAYSEVNGASSFGSGAVTYDAVIVPEPSFSVSPSSLDFGPLVLHEDNVRNLTLTLRNNGTQALANIALSVTDPHFSVTPSTIPLLDINASVDVSVTYTAQTPAAADHRGRLAATSGTISRSVSLSGSTHTRPRTPVNIKPSDGETGVSLSPTLTASVFSSEEACGHEGTKWIVWDATGTIVYVTSVKQGAGFTDFDSANKTTLKLPAGILKTGEKYYWNVTYRERALVVSGPSTPTIFVTTTDPAPPNDPPSVQPTATDSGGGGGGGGCMVATAVFGTPLAPEVLVLKEFRDRYLLSSRAGRRLVALYYRHSPPVADLIARNTAARTATQYLLVVFVSGIKHPVPALGIFALTAVSGALLIYRVRRCRKRGTRKHGTIRD